ncbi:bifunctional DNA primase/polymerase [Microbacterium algeriense]|uniref:AAA family ATPase n=1 Tax=Microbacterium algeriense TaxID=2615184 RepID=A0ABQ6V6C9_9MICO|nr:bifunctional DNA primase/polymerase [Microbacterium algeriense]KAB1864570.1 AAA family ATPase [Microbacterium algeriense]
MAKVARTLDELRQFTDRGWKIFPVVPNAKNPWTSNGYKAGTTDQSTIKRWLEEKPDANWGVATGETSDLLVVDLDTNGNGEQTLREWFAQRSMPWPNTYTVRTPSGGMHLYFHHVDGLRSAAKLMPGVDVRTTGGLVVLPGSIIDGRTYVALSDAERLAHVPALLADALRSRAQSDSIWETPSDWTAGVSDGRRDDYLFRLACDLRRRLKDDRALVTQIVLQAAANCDPPFPEPDALRKVQSAFEQDHSDGFELSRAPFQAEQEGEVPRLNLRSAGEVRTVEPPAYMIDGVLPVGALFQVFGQTGSYKSFVMLDMLGCVANDIPWMGHRINEPGPVAFILGEGGYDAGVRLDAWLKAHPGASDEHMVYSIEEQLDLMRGSVVDAIIEDLEAYRADRFPGKGWRLIVFDTQADHMPSGDEDRSKDFTVLKRAIQRIAHETGAAVGLVHHTGWDDSRERGSSRQRQALDVVMQVKSQRITNVKQKGAALFDPIDFATEGFGDSIVVQRVSPIVAASDTLDADIEQGRRVLTYLHDHPGASQNAVQSDLKLGRTGTWPRLRDLLDKLGYLDVTKTGDGRVREVRPSVRGLAFYGIGDV